MPSVITRNLHRALDRRLQGSACEYLGPDAGLATVETTVDFGDDNELDETPAR
jgi:hypothetical protein